MPVTPMRSESSTTIKKASSKNELAPVTPGAMLKEEFLAEYGLSQNQLAKAIGISANRIAEIINNHRRITADTALRLARTIHRACEGRERGAARSARRRKSQTGGGRVSV